MSDLTSSTQLPLAMLEEPSWVRPTSLPNWSMMHVVAVDVETRDDHLHELGAGDIRGDGYVVGVSVAVSAADKLYIPLRHLEGNNFDHGQAIPWLKGLLGNPQIIKVGANITYDIGWLRTLGIEFQGPLYDVTFAESIIDEDAYSSGLDACCQKYLGINKNEQWLKYAAEMYGVDPKKELWKLPAKYVGQYGEDDAAYCLEIRKKQLEEIKKQQLEEILKLEMNLIYVVSKMRYNGVRINEAAAEQLADMLKDKEKIVNDRIRGFCEGPINIWSAHDLARACNHLGIQFPTTSSAKPQPSFTKEFLEASGHPFLEAVRESRGLNKLRTTFVEDLVSNHVVRGRIHATFNQLKRDLDGTRGGRFSMSNPNLQQIPSRHELAKYVRALFLPDNGLQWGKFDYSQQEPRLMVHYGAAMRFTGGADFCRAYHEDSNTDFYKLITDAAKITRRQAKDLSLGRSYGMGFKKMAEKLNCSHLQAKKYLELFDEAAPFVRELAESCQSKADRTGYIRTLGGRRRHFELWAPVEAFKPDYVVQEFNKPMPYEEARAKYPGRKLTRFGTRKAFNALIQGSAADMMKKAIYTLYKELHIVPYVTVHDEVGIGLTPDQDIGPIKEILLNAYPLRVPMKVDIDVGDTWK